jgi:hypothetical protein
MRPYDLDCLLGVNSCTIATPSLFTTNMLCGKHCYQKQIVCCFDCSQRGECLSKKLGRICIYVHEAKERKGRGKWLSNTK